MSVVFSQWLLPLALASMMLIMGLSLKPEHFAKLLHSPLHVVLGLALQWLLLPLLAVAWISWLALPPSLALGLVLLAACPGGATSNIISHLSGGDGALSVTLTGIVSLLAPITIPLSVAAQLALLDQSDVAIQLSWWHTAGQLLLITALPLVLGMWLTHRWSMRVNRHLIALNRGALLLFMLLVLAMTLANMARLPELWSQTTLACLGLCISAMLLTRILCHPCSATTRTTLMIEVGIQNAGTAMVLALTLLQRPELALVALFYGILMNAPALLMIARQQWQQASYTHVSTGTEKGF